VEDISGSHPTQVILELLLVWDLLQEIQIQPGVLITTVGCQHPLKITLQSAYEHFLVGSTTFEPAARIWKS
jgi:hypothetical protein